MICARSIPASILPILLVVSGCGRENVVDPDSDSSPSAEFSAPSPNSPKNGAIITTGFRVRLGWRAVSGATKYHVEVWKLETPEILTHNFLSDTTSVILDTLGRATYYWHVSGISPRGLAGPWSASRRFILLGPP